MIIYEFPIVWIQLNCPKPFSIISTTAYTFQAADTSKIYLLNVLFLIWIKVELFNYTMSAIPYSWISWFKFLKVPRRKSCTAQTSADRCRGGKQCRSWVFTPAPCRQTVSGTAELPRTDSGTGKDVDDKVRRLKWFSSEAQLRDSDIKAHAASFSLFVLHAHPSLASTACERQQKQCLQWLREIVSLGFTVCSIVESSFIQSLPCLFQSGS